MMQKTLARAVWATMHDYSRHDMVHITPRERQVAGYVALGLTNREIAIQTTISPRTVQTYITLMLRKLMLDNRTQLAVLFSK